MLQLVYGGEGFGWKHLRLRAFRGNGDTLLRRMTVIGERGYGRGMSQRHHLLAYLEHIVEAFEELEEFEVFGENVVVDGEGWGGGGRKRASMKGMHAAREAGVISLMTKAEMDRVSPAFHLTFTMRSTVARASNPAGSHITVGQVKLQIVR